MLTEDPVVLQGNKEGSFYMGLSRVGRSNIGGGGFSPKPMNYTVNLCRRCTLIVF